MKSRPVFHLNVRITFQENERRKKYNGHHDAVITLHSERKFSRLEQNSLKESLSQCEVEVKFGKLS